MGRMEHISSLTGGIVSIHCKNTKEQREVLRVLKRDTELKWNSDKVLTHFYPGQIGLEEIYFEVKKGKLVFALEQNKFKTVKAREII